MSYQVRAIEIDLPAVVVNDLASLLNLQKDRSETPLTACRTSAYAIFEDTVSGWVSDHEGSKIILVLFSLGLEILQIQRSVSLILDGNYLHASHDSRSRVGTVCRAWNQADIPLLLPSRAMVCSDH